jgi:hypothetical protein
MQIDFDALLATATSFIKGMGRPASLRAIDGSTPDQAVTAMMTNYGIAERDGQLIGRDDRRAIVAATPGVAPDPERHQLVLDGTAFRIVTVRPLDPASTTLYFDCQVRGR